LAECLKEEIQKADIGVKERNEWQKNDEKSDKIA